MASIRSSVRNLLKIQKQCMSSQSSSNISPNIPKHLQKAYEKFQRDDGVPVYLKGGPFDRILFGFTVLIIAGGLANAAYTLICLDHKK